MTLSEIETILEELIARHKNLDNELLTTLLQSAGWEEKNIKDALLLFKQRSGLDLPEQAEQAFSGFQNKVDSGEESEEAKPVEEITFYDTDGVEEKDLHNVDTSEKVIVRDTGTNQTILSKVAEVIPVIDIVEQKAEEVAIEEQQQKESNSTAPTSSDEPQIPVSQVIQEVDFLTGDRKSEEVDPLLNVDTSAVVDTVNIQHEQELPKVNEIKNEPQSLVVPDVTVTQKITKKQPEIPEGLPLLPFESSEQVWPFSKYKDVFHGEVMPSIVTEKQVDQDKRDIRPGIPPTQRIGPEDDIEIDLEKTPMTKGDESLVFLAGLMLFVIILILGYMYSNGRL